MSFEQTKDAVEKLRVQLYPNLTNQDGAGDMATTTTATDGGLESIREIESELDEMTEGTASEAIGDSDDEIRGDRERTEDDEDDDDEEDDEDNEDFDVEVKILSFFLLNPKNSK